MKEPNSNKVNLVEISQGKIEDVDKYVKTEINGNKFVIDSDLNKAELNLSKEEKQTIKSLINQYNSIPEAQKNDISDILENLNLETKSNLTEQIGFIFKGIISGVEVSADCQQSNWRSYFWWGVRDNMNKCSANYLSYNWGGMWSWATNLMAFACIAAGYFGALAGLVCGGVLAVMQYYSRLSADLDWLADRCNRVRVDFTWYVQYSSGCI